MSSNQLAQRKIHRSTTDKWFGGVAGGLAETYGWDPTLLRSAFVASLLLPIPGSQILIYLIAWAVIPQDNNGF